MYVCNYFYTDDLKFGVLCFVLFFSPITLSAVQSMDHSFDGISIKMEEGAYERQFNTPNFRQTLQFLRKGITNETNTHCMFTMCLLLSMQWNEWEFLLDWWATHRKVHPWVHPSHFKSSHITLSICAQLMPWCSSCCVLPAALITEGNSKLP